MAADGIDLTKIVSGKRERKTLVSKDYSFNEAYAELSDSDAEAVQKSRPAPKKAGARTKECPGCGAKVGISLKECGYCDHSFTAKSTTGPSDVKALADEALAIRERFLFEPEKEEDGSKIITAILGRRPRKGSAHGISRSFYFRPEQSALDSKYDHEYLIKYKDLSYRKCEWLTANDVDAMSIRSKTALSRYLTKIDRNDGNVDQEGDIDPTWMEVEKVLDMREEEVAEIVDGNYNPDEAKNADADEQTKDEQNDEGGTQDENAEGIAEEPQLSLTSRASFASQVSGMEVEESSSSEDEDGEPKTKTVTQIFQHELRCRKLLERIWDDPFAASFVDPVDTDVFEDYLHVVEEPMCLAEVKERLENGEYRRYNQHVRFMNDLRLIWRNCKAYNLHKSQIWHSAHTLSLMSERLFQGWVLSYSDGSIELKEPLGQPWESTCRICQKDERADKVLLCDHCDAAFHIDCLETPLSEIPEGSWMCTRCVAFFERCEKSNKMGVKVLTATAEDEARTNAENAGIRRVVHIRKKKYLVKWRGLSYKECTWETPEDIGDDKMIQEFHALNDAPPDEPPLTRAELDAELRKDRAKPLDMARQPGNHYNPAWDVEAEVYAQIRSLHFLKWDQIPPPALLKECGPESFAYTYGRRVDMVLPSKLSDTLQGIRSSKVEVVDDKKSSPKANDTVKKEKEVSPRALGGDSSAIKEKDIPSYMNFDVKTDINGTGGDAKERDCNRDKAEISEMIAGMLVTVARGQGGNPTCKPYLPVYTSRPRLPRSDRCPSEVEHWMCKGKEELGIRVANYFGRVVIVGFHKYGIHKVSHPLARYIKQGDILTAINGVSVTHLSFKETLSLLVSTVSPFIYLRFLRTLDRSGPEGAKDREALWKRQRDLSGVKEEPKDRADDDSSNMEGADDRDSDEEAEWQDDPELDVVQRYLNRKRPSKTSFRIPEKRSLYQGVFPSEDGRWEAMYYLYTPDESRDNRTDGYGVYKHVGTFDTELEAAKKRDSEMQKHRQKKNKKSSGEVLPEKLNFESDGKTVSKTTMPLFRLVTAERETAADLLKSISKRDYIHADEMSTPSASRNRSVSNEGASPTHADKGVGMDIEGESMSHDGAKIEIKTETQERKSPQGTAADEEEADLELRSLDSRDSDSADEQHSELESSSSDDEASSDGSWDEDENGEWKPKKDIVTEIDGPTTRLLRAVNEVDLPPLRSDWENYILEDNFQKDREEEEEVKERMKAGKLPEPKAPVTNAKQVDQLDMETGEVITTWRSVTDAARGVGCSTTLLHEAITGKKESAGGFHWRESHKAEEEAVKQLLELLDEDAKEQELADDEADVEGDGDPSKPLTRKKRDLSWTRHLYKKSKEYKSPGNKLRDYQLDGVNWLLRCWYQKKSSILADEMGLGKTVQIVAFLEHLYEVENLRGPFLVCVPLSTIGHWRREFENWSKMQINVYHDTGGGRDMRDIIREFEWYYRGRSRRLLKFQSLICTYDDLIRDYEELAEIPWRAVIVDEAHRLRNVNSRLLECIKNVLQRGLDAYGYQHRVLLTGTPLQNNTAELWSLLNFIEPAKFPDAEKFQSRFGNIQTQDQVLGLQRRLAPHLLRRVKEDVAKDIPPKEETIIDVELTTIQKQYYRAIYEHNHGFLMQQMKGHMPKLMNIQMELRKCCNHPYLVNGVEELEESNLDEKLRREATTNEERSDETARSKKEAKVARRKAADKEYVRRRMEENIIPTSGKMVLLDKLLPKLRKEGHKVLIFSQMVRMLDLIGEFCEYRKYPNERLDGRVSGNDRQKGIDRFNKDPDSFIFLLSTRAGGVGINLTAADTVIIFDSDWNPQNDVQAMARCHRIGQEKHVTIYRLITRRSFEAEMFDRASRKLGLEQAVLGTRKFNDTEGDEEKKIDSKEMEQLLKEGAYAVLLDDEEQDQEMKEFCEQDIDKILASRAHVHITEGGQKTESWLNKKKKSRARKTKFVGASDDTLQDVDVNDPDFWRKVLPDLNTPDSMLERMEAMDEDERFDKKKFMKDLKLMIDGVTDLHHRGNLPDRDRQICMDLLLRLTLNEDTFSEKDRSNASEWMAVIEGTRNRRNRLDLSGKSSSTENMYSTYDGDHDGAIYGELDSDSDSVEDEGANDSDDSTKKARGRKRKGGRGPDKKPRKNGGPGSRGGKGGYKRRREPQYDAEGNIIPVKRGRKPKEVDPNAPPKPKRAYVRKEGETSTAKRAKFDTTYLTEKLRAKQVAAELAASSYQVQQVEEAPVEENPVSEDAQAGVAYL